MRRWRWGGWGEATRLAGTGQRKSCGHWVCGQQQRRKVKAWASHPFSSFSNSFPADARRSWSPSGLKELAELFRGPQRKDSLWIHRILLFLTHYWLLPLPQGGLEESSRLVPLLGAPALRGRGLEGSAVSGSWQTSKESFPSHRFLLVLPFLQVSPHSAHLSSPSCWYASQCPCAEYCPWCHCTEAEVVGCPPPCKGGNWESERNRDFPKPFSSSRNQVYSLSAVSR